MNRIGNLADKFWSITREVNRYAFIYLFISLIFSTAFIIIGVNYEFPFLSLVFVYFSIAYFLIGLYEKDMYLIEKLGVEAENVSMPKMGKALADAQRKYLVELLESAGLQAKDIVAASMMITSINEKIPTKNVEDIDTIFIREFLLGPNSKPRAITLFVSLSALVSVLLITSADQSVLQSVILNIWTNFLSFILLEFIGLIVLGYLAIQIFVISNFVFSYIPILNNKKSYFIRNCKGILTIKDLSDLYIRR